MGGERGLQSDSVHIGSLLHVCNFHRQVCRGITAKTPQGQKWTRTHAYLRQMCCMAQSTAAGPPACKAPPLCPLHFSYEFQTLGRTLHLLTRYMAPSTVDSRTPKITHDRRLCCDQSNAAASSPTKGCSGWVSTASGA